MKVKRKLKKLKKYRIQLPFSMEALITLVLPSFALPNAFNSSSLAVSVKEKKDKITICFQMKSTKKQLKKK